MLVTFVTGILLARVLGPDLRGEYGVIQTWIQFGSLFFSLSFFDALVIRARERDGDAADLVPVSLRFAVITAALSALVLAPLVYSGTIPVDTVGTSAVFAILVCALALMFVNQSFESIERSALKFSRLNIERVVSPVIFMSLILVSAVTLNISVTLVLFAFCISKIPMLIVRCVRFRRSLFLPFVPQIMRDVSRLGPRLHIATGAQILSQNIDRLVIAALWPQALLGYYFVAFTAASAGMSLAVQGIQLTLLPQFAGMVLSDKSKVFEKIFRIAVVIGLATATGVWAIAPWLIPWAYGDVFLPAVAFTKGLAFSMTMLPPLAVVTVAHRSAGQSLPGVHMALASLIVFMIGFFLTRFSDPVHLFACLALANLAALGVGLLHLASQNVIGDWRRLIPTFDDLFFLGGKIISATHTLKGNIQAFFTRGPTL